MSPEDYRQLRIKPGALLGLIGDWNAPSLWSHNKLVTSTLKAYQVLERRHTLEKQGEVVWDTAAISVLASPLQTISVDSEECVVAELLLIQRYLNLPWDNDCVVHIYGIRTGELLGLEPLQCKNWLPKTVWLSAAATMTVLPNT